MNSRKKNLVIILILAIAVLALLYWGGGLFVSEYKNPYYKEYIDLYELDFSKVDDLSSEKKEQYLGELEVWKELLKRGKKGDLVKSFIGLAFLKKITLDYEGAEQALILAGEVDSLNTVSFGNLGNLYYYFIKDYPKAEQAYLKAIDNYPFNIDFYRDLGNLYQYKFDDINKKEEIVIRAVKNNPGDPDSFKLAISFYVEQEDKDKAVWYFERLREIAPDAATLFEEKINAL